MKIITHFCRAFFLLSVCYTQDAHCQPSSSVSPKSIQSNKVAKAYSRAICEYIKAVYKGGVRKPDTLYIGKNGDTPDIKLPRAIEGINVIPLKNEDAQKKLSHRNSFVYLNVASWINRLESEFLIVTFYDFKPQYHTSIYLKHNAAGDEMKLDSLGFQYPYVRK